MMSEPGGQQVRKRLGHSKEVGCGKPLAFLFYRGLHQRKEPPGYMRQGFTWQEWFANAINTR